MAESDRLEHAREMDGRYHLAKLVSNALNDPQLIWDEHQEFRLELLTAAQPDRPQPTPDWAKVQAIHRRLVESGIVAAPRNGVQH